METGKYDEALRSFGRLLEIMDELREKCPWDKVQTLETLRTLTVEETFELSEAILSGDFNAIRGELGDILLHIVFYARIGREQGQFDIREVIDVLCEKLIRRHPHIYGTVEADSPEKVAQNWEKIKLSERKSKRTLEGVPAGLPPLLKAYRMQEKTGALGFEWKEREGVFEKIKEELAELETEANQNPINAEKLEGEFGDLLFALVNYSRYLNINPDDALEQTNRKFMRRFLYIEEQAEAQGRSVKNMTLEEMDALWNEAKKAENPA